MYAIRMKSTIFAAAAVALALLIVPMSAFASTATATIAISATVVKTCLISTNALSFGNYSGTALNVSTTLTVTCTNSTTYDVGLNPGTGSGATDSNRLMTLSGGGATLNYELLSGSFTGSNWGNTSTDGWVAGTGDGAAQTLTVYGVVPASQYPTPGSYADTITATVNY